MSSRAKGSVSTERHATSTSPEAVRIEAVAGPVRQTKGTPRCRAISWSESDFRNQRFELPLPAELVHRRAQWRIWRDQEEQMKHYVHVGDGRPLKIGKDEPM